MLWETGSVNESGNDVVDCQVAGRRFGAFAFAFCPAHFFSVLATNVTITI